MNVIVCSVLIMRGNSVLLVKENKEVAKDKYGLPGGKLELGESLRECGIRECLEETGLKVKLNSLVMVSHKPNTHEGNSVMKYIYKAIIDDQPSMQAEMTYAFYTLDEVEEFSSNNKLRGKDVAELARRIKNGQLVSIPEPDMF